MRYYTKMKFRYLMTVFFSKDQRSNIFLRSSFFKTYLHTVFKNTRRERWINKWQISMSNIHNLKYITNTSITLKFKLSIPITFLKNPSCLVVSSLKINLTVNNRLKQRFSILSSVSDMQATSVLWWCVSSRAHVGQIFHCFVMRAVKRDRSLHTNMTTGMAWSLKLLVMLRCSFLLWFIKQIIYQIEPFVTMETLNVSYWKQLVLIYCSNMNQKIKQVKKKIAKRNQFKLHCIEWLHCLI